MSTSSRPARSRRRALIASVAVIAGTAAAVAVGFSLPADATPSSTSGHHPSGAKPTIVLVHGAWSGTASWNGEVTALQHDGYTVRAITNPLRDLTTDSEFVADFIRTIKGPVVLVGHSYGGSVITNAAAEVSNVTGLVYVDGYAPAVGETSMSLNGAGSVLNRSASELYEQTPYPGAPAGGVETSLKLPVFIRSFGNDLPASQDKLLWATQGAATNVAFATPSKYAAWKTIPSWYFISTGDKVVTPSSELAMAHRAHSHITVFAGGSHLTLISHPSAVTAVILKAAHAHR